MGFCRVKEVEFSDIYNQPVGTVGEIETKVENKFKEEFGGENEYVYTVEVEIVFDDEYGGINNPFPYTPEGIKIGLGDNTPFPSSDPTPINLPPVPVHEPIPVREPVFNTGPVFNHEPVFQPPVFTPPLLLAPTIVSIPDIPTLTPIVPTVGATPTLPVSGGQPVIPGGQTNTPAGNVPNTAPTPDFTGFIDEIITQGIQQAAPNGNPDNPTTLDQTDKVIELLNGNPTSADQQRILDTISAIPDDQINDFIDQLEKQGKADALFNQLDAKEHSQLLNILAEKGAREVQRDDAWYEQAIEAIERGADAFDKNTIEALKALTKVETYQNLAEFGQLLFLARGGFSGELNVLAPEAVKDAQQQLFNMVEDIKDDFVKEWKNAEAQGGELELAIQWSTTGVLDVATSFIGAGVVKNTVNVAGKLVNGFKKVTEAGDKLSDFNRVKDIVRQVDPEHADDIIKALEDTANGKEVPAELLAKLDAEKLDDLGRQLDEVIGETLPIRKEIELKPGQKGSWNNKLNEKLDPSTNYNVGNKTYKTDEHGRVKQVSGELALKTNDRNTFQQGKAGQEGGIKDGLENDDGGHLISSRHDGAGEQINYVPMDSNLNRGEWKRMENKWDDALKEGKKVEVDINPIYEGNSKRPEAFSVKYWVDGKKKTAFFENKPGG